MGRTLHYSLEGQISSLDTARILVAQALWNRSFTWTCEELSWVSPEADWFPNWDAPWFKKARFPETMTSPEAYDFVREVLAAGVTIPDLLGLQVVKLHESPDALGARVLHGFTKVRSDEWNAKLVTLFAVKIAEAFPSVKVHLSDEGGYVLSGNVIFSGDTVSLDEPRVAEQRGYLKSRGLTTHLAHLEDAVARAEDGEFFASVPAGEYLDRKEFKEIGLTHEERGDAKLTLDDLELRISFPGEDFLPRAEL